MHISMYTYICIYIYAYTYSHSYLFQRPPFQSGQTPHDGLNLRLLSAISCSLHGSFENEPPIAN